MIEIPLATTIRTKNIQDAINEYATQNFIPISECDFQINQIETFIKTVHEKGFNKFFGDISEFDEAKILNEHIEFQQIYTVTIAPKKECVINLIYKIEWDEYKTDPKLLLGSNSRIPYQTYQPKEILILLYKEINKIKALNHILVQLFDTTMKNNLKVLTKYIYGGKFKKTVKIALFDGITPEVTKQAKVIYWFLERKTEHQIIEVEANEILVEFKKPKYGRNGFNAFGKRIDNEYYANQNEFKAEIDLDTIYIEENDDKKLYRSKHKGYVSFEDDYLKISNKINVQKISRVQDSLAKDEANKIEVHILQTDTSKDSIGEGVELVSETIQVSGHVGAKSVLEAINLHILGATHQDSTQFAKFANINRHKGKLRCHSAKIALLEGGEVHASTVEIESCLSGTIYAQDVIIGNVKSNLKVYASHSITIRNVSGEDNLFKINYQDIPIMTRKLEYITKDMENLKYDIETATRNKSENLEQLKKRMHELREQHDTIKNSVKTSCISVDQPFQGLNTIIFTIDNNHEIIYKTEAKSYKPFYLEITEDFVKLHPTNKILRY
ncbi:MAG: FapA family protein [Sulfurimonadaceae bacterium]|nr:FapA family protein [Sulfurimonadaceae bacterium]